MPGTLYVIATPIGNLEDISARAKRILSEVDVILCEDTRVTKKLLFSLEIENTLLSYHQHSDIRRRAAIADGIAEGKTYALVSDAGTPGISDPGGKLVELLVDRFHEDVVVTPIPGPNAAIAALSVSGFPADEFVFLGFPPHKKRRNQFFERLPDISSTIVFYESKHRILKALASCANVIPDRQLVLCRELTKKFETIYRGTPAQVTERLESDRIKGEFVCVIGPKS